MSKIIIFLCILFFFTSACSEKIKYKDLAVQKSIEMNCESNVELLVHHEETELWASHSKTEKDLLCVYMCKKNFCSYSTERD